VRSRLKALVVKTPLAPFRRFRRALRVRPRGDLVRLGSDYGGWTVPTDLVERSWVCYSGGVGDDITFDLAFIERFGCEVDAFDPTPSSVEHVRLAADDEPRFHFHPWGVWSDDATVRFYAPDYSDTNFSAVNLHDTEDFFEAPCRSLPSIMRELGHDRIDLLKLDIEGAEYEVLDALLGGDIRPTVLCVEFHKTSGIGPMRRTASRMRAIGYDAVAVRGYDVTFVRPAD
jgi:FkbM family methyltransferase